MLSGSCIVNEFYVILVKYVGGRMKRYFWCGLFSVILGIIFSLYSLTNDQTVILEKDLQVEFNSKVFVSDFIYGLDGTLVNDSIIDTTKLGVNKVRYYYINDYGWYKSATFNIEVIDTVKPVIMVGSTFVVNKGDSRRLEEIILCADNVDDNVKCNIIGEYNLDKVDNYKLKMVAEDASGNKSEVEFVLEVVNKKVSNITDNSYIKYSDVYDKYKSDSTRIGIDISRWQGDIDFKELKKNNVEFVMIKLGGQTEIDGEIEIDPYFYDNIEAALEAGIEVGVYFYSYAKSVREAKKQAKYVINAIDDYEVSLPIAFDWENFNEYNQFKLSFYSLNNIAKSFFERVAESGYEGILYSSRAYLDTIWNSTDYEVWLANYSNIKYDGDYVMWQVCSDGKVDGIDGYVDIDVYYK